MVTGQVGPRLDHGLSNLETVHDLDECFGQRFGTKVFLRETQERVEGLSGASKSLETCSWGGSGKQALGERLSRLKDV